jgi:hypothetical protein
VADIARHVINTHFEALFIMLDGTLRRGKRWLPGPAVPYAQPPPFQLHSLNLWHSHPFFFTSFRCMFSSTSPSIGASGRPAIKARYQMNISCKVTIILPYCWVNGQTERETARDVTADMLRE